jgi:hypothetical protein
MEAESMTPQKLVTLLNGYRYSLDSENALQEGIAKSLRRENVEFEREVPLTKRDRIDFMVGRIGLEVKIGGTFSMLLRQLDRYAQCPEVDALVVMASRSRLTNVPCELRGKPICVCGLLGSKL